MQAKQWSCWICAEFLSRKLTKRPGSDKIQKTFREEMA